MADTNTIGRTITLTRVQYTKGGTAKKIYKDTLVGKRTKESAQRLLRKDYGDGTIVVRKVVHESKRYVMNVWDFINGSRVTRTY